MRYFEEEQRSQGPGGPARYAQDFRDGTLDSRMLSKFRKALPFAAAPLVVIAAVHLLYALFLGRMVVRAMYEGTAPAAMGGVVQGKDVYPIERYFLQADLEFRRLSQAALPPTLVLSALIMGAGLLAPWTARKILGFLGLVGVLVAACLGINRWRLDVRQLDLACEHLLNRAKDVADRAPSFRQERALAALSSTELNGFCRWLETDLPKARIVIAPPAGHPSDASLLEFRFGSKTPPAFAPQTSPHQVTEGHLRCQLLEGDVLVNAAPIDVALNDLSQIEIRMRNEKGKNATLSLSTSFPPDPAAASPLRFRIKPGRDFQTYSVRTGSLAKTLGEKANLRAISLRPSDAATDEVEIESIKLISRLSKYAQAPAAISYESLKGEIRRVIHARLPSRLVFPLQLPDTPSVLTFGTGVLKSDLPVRFTVTVSDGFKRAAVFQRTEIGSTQWNDARIDLSPWAGKAIEIELDAQGAPGNVAFWASPGVRSAAPRKLNVVILLQDSLRGDRLGFEETPGVNAPVMRQLVQEGVVFSNAFSQETKTRPSIPCLLTSLLPSATGVWFDTSKLSDHYLTLTEILRDQGFSTALFTQNPNVGRDSNLHQGFEVLFNDLPGTGANADEFLGQRLLEWVEAQAERNFFLYIHLIDPHGPYDPPSPRNAAFDDASSEEELPRMDELDAHWIERPTAQGRRLLYDAEIALNDRWIGNFLEVLGERRDETLLVLCADHGESLGEHGFWGHEPPGYHVGLHVPLIVVYPPALPAGRSVEEPVQLIDVMPTILDLAKIEKSELLLHGESLLPLMDERPDGAKSIRLALSEEFVNRREGDEGGRGSLMLRDWHLLSSQDLLSPNKVFSWLPDLGLSTRVFNYRSDPREKKLWNTFLLDWMLKAKVRDTLLALEETNRDVMAALTDAKKETVEMDPEVEERMRALGYLK